MWIWKKICIDQQNDGEVYSQPFRQGDDGGDQGPAFREERRVHRVPRKEAAGQ